MSKTIMAAAALSVVAGLGVAALPLSSYAADLNTASENIDVIVNIDNTISMAVDTNAVEMNLVPGGAAVTDKTVTATVTTNNATGYELYIRDSDDSTALVSAEGNSINAGATLSGAASAWAYQGGDVTGWTAITTDNAKIKTVTNPTGTDNAGQLDQAAARETVITFGAYAESNQQSGIYKGGVTLTAVATGATANPGN